MKTIQGRRAGLAAATSMLVLGVGLIAAPMMANAVADVVVDNTPDYTVPFSSDGNLPGFFCGYDDEGVALGTKYEPVTTPYLLTSPASLLVLKASSSDTAFEVHTSPVVGVAYARSDGKDISHVILCLPQEVTTPPVTTEPVTTPPITTPPVTTEPVTTPPETTPPETTPVDTGTTTPSTSSPAESATTTSAAAPTSSRATLPTTGPGSNSGALLATGVGLLAAGVTLLFLTRRTGSHA